MKARLERWGFACLMFSLVVLAYVANLVPEPSPPGRHRAPGPRATRTSDREVRAQRDAAAWNRQAFAALSRVPDHDVVIGRIWGDPFDVPPLPQRRFRALAPRALAASAISAREALRRDQEAIAGDFDRALARLVKDQEVS